MTRSFAITLNAFGLCAIALVLAGAFAAQLLLNELPCPLCLLQRCLFALLAIGPVLNIRYGPRPAHYALALLTACAGAAVAMRQILLHVMPGDPGYGSALLGYHFYTWAFIAFAAAIVLIAIVLLFDGQFHGDGAARPVEFFVRSAVWLIIVLAALNVISVFVECGSTACPDNPTTYELLRPSP
jgi:disulfide bond formation protein DsbB